MLQMTKFLAFRDSLKDAQAALCHEEYFALALHTIVKQTDWEWDK